MSKKITLRAKSDGTVLPPAELVREYPGFWDVRLAEGASTNTFHGHEWELVPPPLPTEPGTVFRATVRGVENVQVTVSDVGHMPYFTHSTLDGCYWHAASDIDPASVVPLKLVEADDD